MSQSAPITILIVNEHAEEIKLVTISLRGFFPDIRIDAAYSAEEATVMASSTASNWAVILIDGACLPQASPRFIDDLKQRASYASIILQSDRTDSAAALQALQLGADFYLYKHSPAFLTELLFCVKEAFDKRDWRMSADRAEIRHHWLIDSFSEIFYELDAEGRFLSVSPNISALLGYRPDELIGQPYHLLLAETEQPQSRFRFKERRTGARAAASMEVTLLAKPTAEGIIRKATHIMARGLYDLSRQYRGTIGMIRDLSARTTLMAHPESRPDRQRTDLLTLLVRQMAELSGNLQQPLRTLLLESRQLAETLRESRLIERLEALTAHAEASANVGEQLARVIRETSHGGQVSTINSVLADLLNSPLVGADSTSGVVTDFMPSPPPYLGDPERTVRLFRQVLAYAVTCLNALGRSPLLLIRTSQAGLSSSSDTPTLFPLMPAERIEVVITETERRDTSGRSLPFLSEPLDLLSLYRVAGELGAALDVSAPSSAPLRITVSLPVPTSSTQPQPPLVGQGPATTQTPAASPSIPPAPVTAGVVTTDRRVHPRVSTVLPAKINIGTAAWEGTVLNVSLGGACIGVPSDFPSIALQEVHIAAKTAVSVLQLSGLVYARTRSETPRAPTRSHLILVFHPPAPTESAVFASLIDAVHEQSLAFTLEILLVAGPLGLHPPGDNQPFELAQEDRRENVRVPLSLPAKLETLRRQEPADRLSAQLKNLSRSGASLVVQERPDDLQGPLHIHFAPAQRGEHTGSPEPGAPDATLPAHVVWSLPDSSAPTRLHVPGLTYATQAGVRFQSLTPYAERELNRVIRQHVLAQGASETQSTTVPVSIPRECRNARGQVIAITDDHLGELAEPNIPTIIMAPGYGQTASDYVALAYYLARHHFRVLRYDPTNHLGNSEGELQQTTLRSMQHDLGKVIEYVRHTWPQAPVLVIASDLAARAALKTVSQTRPLDLLLLVNPSLDVGSILMAVHGHDLVADYQFGLRRGVCNLLGHNVNVDQFVGDVIAGRFSDLESTLDDLRAIRSPLCIATSPATSTALPPADLPHAFMTALGAHSKLVNISTALTERNLDVQGTPPAAFKQLLKQISSVIPVQALQPEQEVSAQPYIVRQRRLEQEYTFLRHEGSQINREALSAAHVSQLPHLGNLHEYRKLLDDLYGLMSPLDPGAVLVDAGLGQSDLTRAALVNHTYRAGHASWIGQSAPLMVGVGRSAERIGQSRHAVLVLQRELATGFIGRLAAMPPLTIGWIQADWMEALPFKTGSLIRLVCNLSLPYVPSPLAALREWHRALHPDGCLIFTTFHPDTDLSPLYRRHLRQANQDEFSAQAQPLLYYFGRLREAIRHRTIHTFDEAGLAGLLRQCGMNSFRILPIFDGQALVAIVGKRNSSSPRR